MPDSAITVREIRAADAASFADLVSTTLNECFDAVLPGDELASWTQLYRNPRPSRMYFVAESGGKLWGYAMADDVGADAGHPATVERLYIRHDTDNPSRGRAVALALVSAVHAKTHTAPTTDRDATLSLFERWGFVDMRALRMCLTSSSSDGRLLGGDALEW